MYRHVYPWDPDVLLEAMLEAMLDKELEPGSFGVSKERPDFGPTQVRSISEITPGRYRVHYTGFDGMEIEVEAVVSLGERTEMRLISGEIYPLDDVGVVEYKNGRWNGTNWLERLEP